MLVRFAFIAAVTFTSTTAVAAQPAKPSAPHSTRLQPAPVPVVLASVEDLRPASSADQQPVTAPKRPRIGRVTTCRCGDPLPGDPEVQPEE